MFQWSLWLFMIFLVGVNTHTIFIEQQQLGLRGWFIVFVIFVLGVTLRWIQKEEEKLELLRRRLEGEHNRFFRG